MGNKERDDARKEVNFQSLILISFVQFVSVIKVGVLAQMKHPYIVSYMESFEGNDELYSVAMDQQTAKNMSILI